MKYSLFILLLSSSIYCLFATTKEQAWWIKNKQNDIYGPLRKELKPDVRSESWWKRSRPSKEEKENHLKEIYKNKEAEKTHIPNNNSKRGSRTSKFNRLHQQDTKKPSQIKTNTKTSKNKKENQSNHLFNFKSNDPKVDTANINKKGNLKKNQTTLPFKYTSQKNTKRIYTAPKPKLVFEEPERAPKPSTPLKELTQVHESKSHTKELESRLDKLGLTEKDKIKKGNLDKHKKTIAIKTNPIRKSSPKPIAEVKDPVITSNKLSAPIKKHIEIKQENIEPSKESSIKSNKSTVAIKAKPIKEPKANEVVKKNQKATTNKKSFSFFTSTNNTKTTHTTDTNLNKKGNIKSHKNAIAIKTNSVNQTKVKDVVNKNQETSGSKKTFSFFTQTKKTNISHTTDTNRNRKGNIKSNRNAMTIKTNPVKEPKVKEVVSENQETSIPKKPFSFFTQTKKTNPSHTSDVSRNKKGNIQPTNNAMAIKTNRIKEHKIKEVSNINQTTSGSKKSFSFFNPSNKTKASHTTDTSRNKKGNVQSNKNAIAIKTNPIKESNTKQVTKKKQELNKPKKSFNFFSKKRNTETYNVRHNKGNIHANKGKIAIKTNAIKQVKPKSNKEVKQASLISPKPPKKVIPNKASVTSNKSFPKHKKGQVSTSPKASAIKSPTSQKFTPQVNRRIITKQPYTTHPHHVSKNRSHKRVKEPNPRFKKGYVNKYHQSSVNSPKPARKWYNKKTTPARTTVNKPTPKQNSWRSILNRSDRKRTSGRRIITKSKELPEPTRHRGILENKYEEARSNKWLPSISQNFTFGQKKKKDKNKKRQSITKSPIFNWFNDKEKPKNQAVRGPSKGAIRPTTSNAPLRKRD